MVSRTDFDIAIIGGGIVGLAAGYRIACSQPALKIGLLEKEAELATHQTGHNSGVIHSGLYYKPSSEKALTCTAGRRELLQFAGEHGIPHRICGKIVVATAPEELERLESLYERGQSNGVEGLERLDGDGIRAIEPACAGIAGLKVACTGIIDFVAVARKLGELMIKAGSQNRVLTSHEVRALDRHDYFTRVVTNQGSFDTRFIINCAGLQCDRVAIMDQIEPGVRIIPFRGDYYELTEAAAGKVRALIYPVPDPAFPFLGVHLTRMLNGSVECGPNAVLAFKREGYGRRAFSWRDSWQTLAYGGTLRLFSRHWRYGLGECRRALSRKRFARDVQRLVPEITEADLRPGKCGVRAQAVGPRGELVDDFHIVTGVRSVHVLNAPSPAATAALAIGERICRIAHRHFGLDSGAAKAVAERAPQVEPDKTGKRKGRR